MGQGVSKAIGKSAGKAIKQASAGTKPPVPPGVSAQAPATKAANPARFLRGEGIAQQDIRDVGQEMFLQSKHKVDDKEKEKAQEMPPDLLKFITDVGPAKQKVDKDFTAPRLLEKENEEELNKTESSRNVIRERKRMPLMGEDENFTTVRNTNFSDGTGPEEVSKDFGISSLPLFEILSKKPNEKDMAANVDTFCESLFAEQDGWADQEKEEQKQQLLEALQAVDLPVLRQDTNGDILGLYPNQVPGPEVKSFRPLSPSKVKLVLADLLTRSGDTEAVDNLERRRRERKGTKPL